MSRSPILHSRVTTGARSDAVQVDDRGHALAIKLYFSGNVILSESWHEACRQDDG
jgi:hypothetical protein